MEDPAHLLPWVGARLTSLVDCTCPGAQIVHSNISGCGQALRDIVLVPASRFLGFLKG